MIKVTSRIVINELERRDVPVEVISESPYTLLRYFHKGSWHLLRSTLPETSSAVGRGVCDQKYVSFKLATANGIPVPETKVYTSYEEARAFMQKHGSIVVKPSDAAHGHGVTVGVATEGALRRAVNFAMASSSNGVVLLQQKVDGSDLRMLVIGGRFVAATRRIPASVTGDGKKTLRELIRYENETNPERGENDEKRLSLISLDASERFLGSRLDSEIPAANEKVTVVGTANIGAGGLAMDYTDNVPAEIIAAAETFAQTVKIIACGVDFIWSEETGKFYFIEGNACPGFCLHIEPAVGTSRPVDRHFVDVLLGVTEPTWATAEKAS